MGVKHEKTAGILFSGGDAPGMNALLRSFVRVGINGHHWNVIGIENGFHGLVHRLLAVHYAETAWDALTADPPRSGVIGLQCGRFVVQRFGDLPSTDVKTSALRDYHLQKVLRRW
jgi:hypothetical protein